MTRILTLSFTLLLLFGVAWVSLFAYEPDLTQVQLTILMGFVLLVSSVAGSLARSVRLPRITGFLVVGIVAGPWVTGIVPLDALDRLRLIDEFALALIAMLAGGELELGKVRRAAKNIVFITGGVVAVVWLGVTLVFIPLAPFLPFLDGAGLGAILALGGLLGIWAANSSPDLTVAVIEETGAKGPLTDVILGVTIVKDVVVIVLFTLFLALVESVLGPGGSEKGLLLELVREVGGALLAGAGLGWVFSLFMERRGRPPVYLTFLFAYVLVVVSDLLHVELLLAGVAAGFVIENLSEAGDEIIRSIESIAVVIFAFFFTIAGASLDLHAIGRFWAVAAVLFSARLLLTYWGVRLGERWAGAAEAVRGRTWRGLLSQGGVTLGLLLLLEEALPEVGADVVALGMAVIIGNILGGPVLLKTALTRSPTEKAAPGAGDGG